MRRAPFLSTSIRPFSRARASAGFGVFVVIAVAGWAAACSSDEAAPTTVGPAVDAASDTAVHVDASDAGTVDGGKLDCTTDVDGSGLWRHLECTGLYASLADKTVAPEVHPYKPGVEFWSDGAEKQRWIFMPAGGTIDISNFDEWKFPIGTKVWKEFKLGGKRIETRLFTKSGDGAWLFASYRWNAEESSAVIGGAESIPGIGPDGGPYEIPNPGQCDQCHRGKTDSLLGFEGVSLGLPTATGETLSKLAADGRLSAPPPATSLTLPGDATAQAAIGWIHANCGACHSENTSASANHRSHFRVRATDLLPVDGGTPDSGTDAGAPFAKLDVWTQGYCVDTFRTDPDGGAPYKHIRGGSPDASLMYILASHRAAWDELPSSAVQMPPIVTRAVDQQAMASVRAWIESLPPCAN